MSEKKVNNKKKAAQPAKSNSSHDAASQVFIRKEFYKDQSSLMKKAVIGAIGCLAGSVILTFVAATRESDTRYFAINEKGVMNLVALANPNMSDAAVGNWLASSLIDTFDFTYINIREHLNEATLKYFTDNGRTELIDSLDRAGNFDAIINKKLLASLTLDSTPLVVKKGKPAFSNSYLWKLEVPGTMTYRTESQEFTNKLLFTITISRVSQLKNNSGLGIHRIVIEKAPN